MRTGKLVFMVCGLSKSAHLFLAERYKDIFEIIGSVESTFGIRYPLNRYQLKGGTYADEYVQYIKTKTNTEVFFLGLRLQYGSEFVWTKEEMEEQMQFLPAEE